MKPKAPEKNEKIPKPRRAKSGRQLATRKRKRLRNHQLHSGLDLIEKSSCIDCQSRQADGSAGSAEKSQFCGKPMQTSNSYSDGAPRSRLSTKPPVLAPGRPVPLLHLGPEESPEVLPCDSDHIFGRLLGVLVGQSRAEGSCSFRNHPLRRVTQAQKRTSTTSRNTERRRIA